MTVSLAIAPAALADPMDADQHDYPQRQPIGNLLRAPDQPQGVRHQFPQRGDQLAHPLRHHAPPCLGPLLTVARPPLLRLGCRPIVATKHLSHWATASIDKRSCRSTSIWQRCSYHQSRARRRSAISFQETLSRQLAARPSCNRHTISRLLFLQLYRMRYRCTSKMNPRSN